MSTSSTERSSLPPQLLTELDHAGYYPDLIADVVDIAVAGEEIRGYFIHPETTFDAEQVRRHLTVLVVTPTRLVVTHVDDHENEDSEDPPFAMASSEAVTLGSIRSVVLSHAVNDPAQYTPGGARELALAITWGNMSRLDLEPAVCGDSECDADHGLAGTMATDDISVRLSSQAEGPNAIRDALVFARVLSGSISQAKS